MIRSFNSVHSVVEFWPLISAIFNLNSSETNKVTVQESCDIGCKDSLAVFFRSASLITHSKKINLKDF